MIVLDASATVDLLAVREPNASWVAGRLRTDGEISAPHLLDAEVLSAVRGLGAAGQLSPSEAPTVLEDFADLPLVRYPHLHLLPRAWELRHVLTAYDAIYVALAEALEASLVTTDRALARARGHRAKVISPPKGR